MNKFIKYGLYLSCLIPLLFTPFTYFPWHFGKTMIFQILIEILLVLTISASIRTVSLKNWFKSLNYLDWSILVFLAVIIITSLTGANLSNSFWGNQSRANGVFTWLHFSVFYFLLKTYFQEKKDWYIFLVLNIIVAFFVSLISFFPQILPTAWQSISGGGIIGNRAFLAAYLVLAIGLAAYLFFVYQNKWRFLFLGTGLINFVALYLTGNRGSLVGLAVGVGAGLIVALFTSSTKKIKIISGSILVGLGVLFLVLFFLSQNVSFQNKMPRLTHLFNLTNYTSATGETRLMAWQIAWEGIKMHPVLGWGWGNYNIVFDKYYNPQILKYSFSETVWDKPHNWLLEVGNGAGVMGMVSYLAILFFAFYYLFKKTNKSFSKIEKLIFFSILVAYLVQDLFLFETSNGLFLWFIFLALISTNWRISSNQFFNTVISPIKKIIFCLLLLTVCLSLYYFNFLPLKTSYYLQKATSGDVVSWSQNVSKALQVKSAVTNESAIFLAEYLVNLDKAGAIGNYRTVTEPALELADFLEQATQKYPGSLKYPTWAGQIYMILGDKVAEKYYTDAEKIILQAKDVSPQKQETLFLLARLYLLEKKFSQAITANLEAVKVAPNIAVSHWFLALAYGAAGDVKNSIVQIEYIKDTLGESLTKDQNLYLIDMYAADKNFPKVIEAYQKLIVDEPSDLNWYIKLASAYASNGDKKKALETIDYILVAEPSLKAEAEKFIKENNLK
ncbi:MAG: O-antigen ligase family protein [Candidatus Magasanikbacteria bacterium]|nr:O-antigen ligase family protein [Candidatus Magasanikbacteria bacterium]